MLYTNGNRMSLGEDAPAYFQFKILAEHGDEAWVIATNGVFKGERFTFKRKDIWEYNDT